MRWKISNELENYDSSIKFMESEILNIANDELDDLIWLLEYPALYTAGLLAKPNDLLNKNKFPVHLSKRGGKYTYHGPGQRIVYPMINLNKKTKDVYDIDSFRVAQETGSQPIIVGRLIQMGKKYKFEKKVL